MFSGGAMRRFTLATRPLASSVIVGTEILLTDIGVGGSVWRSDGTIWRPHGSCVLVRKTVESSTSSLTEVSLESYALPAGLFQDGLLLRITSLVQKSGVNYTGTQNLRIGTTNAVTGGTPDALALTIAQPAGANRRTPNIYELTRINATSYRFTTSGSGYPYAPVAGASADVTLPNSGSFDANTIYFNHSAYISNVLESLTGRFWQVEIL